jgi:hypothetical protein
MTVREDFMAYVWRYQRFQNKPYYTVDHKEIVIKSPGILNVNAGPDFEQARVFIDGIEWAGSIELHVNASDWELHNHTSDANYNKVILHVVWNNNKPIKRPDGSLLPTFVLKDYIEGGFVDRFKEIITQKSNIKCQNSFKSVSGLAKVSMLEKALAFRLERKSADFLPSINELKLDFEEFAFRVFCVHMGFKLNSEPFKILAENLPYSIIRKHKDNLLQIEALLYGQAGFLENPEGEYAILLAEEYAFLQKKYKLVNGGLSRNHWHFLRTRLGNFPTVRLSQLAVFLNNLPSIFEVFVTDFNFKTLAEALKCKPSEYWRSHYDFNKKSAKQLNGMGQNSISVLILNSASVLLNIYATKTDSAEYFQKIINILETFKAEKNSIISNWESLNLSPQNAFESQALIEQYNSFCTKNKCLSCPIAHELLKAN